MTVEIEKSLIFLIGSLVVVIAGFVIKQWFTNFINKKFDNIYASQQRNEEEREKDNFMTLRGQQVTCDCLHHLNYAVIHGDHIDELEKANTQLDEYRALLNKTITTKASRWNMQIGR